MVKITNRWHSVLLGLLCDGCDMGMGDVAASATSCHT